MEIERLLATVDAVRCLECGEIYNKPARSGTANANPGCPRCGYVGWASTTAPTVMQATEPHRFGADPLQHPSVRPR
jgi:hypothetical protein